MKWFSMIKFTAAILLLAATVICSGCMAGKSLTDSRLLGGPLVGGNCSSGST